MSRLKELLPVSDTSSGYELSNRQLGQTRRWAILALDASALLNLYSYSKQTREAFLQILEDLQDRIWLPHQAAYEYEKNRLRVIKRLIAFSKGTRNLLSCLPEDFAAKAKAKNHPKVGREFQSPFRSIEDIKSQLASAAGEIEDELKPDEDEYKSFLVDDPVRERLDRITCDRIGEPFSQNDLEEIYDDGRKRYDLRRPPGYCDGGKPGVAKYGDLIIWRQLINRARETGRSIYFITDDAKEDWVHKSEKGPDGPRHELAVEMAEHTSKRFLISTFVDFYTKAADSLGIQTSKAAIAEARRVAEQESWNWAMRDWVLAPPNELRLPGLMMPNEVRLPTLTIPDNVVRLTEVIVDAGIVARRQLTSTLIDIYESLGLLATSELFKLPGLPHPATLLVEDGGSAPGPDSPDTEGGDN